MYRTTCTLIGLLAAVVSQHVVELEAADSKADIERWEPSIRKFEEQDQKTSPPQGANLFVGSSSIRMWKLDESFPKLRTINRGFGGSQIADSNHFADRIILKHRPSVVFLYAGDNDIAKGKSPETVTADFRKFVAIVRKELPQTKIGFIAIKPSLARWNLVDPIREANGAIEAICKEDDLLTYIDIFTPMLGEDGKPRPNLFLKDGLHLNKEGYRIWAAAVRPVMAKN